MSIRNLEQNCQYSNSCSSSKIVAKSLQPPQNSNSTVNFNGDIIYAHNKICTIGLVIRVARGEAWPESEHI